MKPDYRKLAQKALDDAKKPKKVLKEGISYAEGHKERMDPRLERELKDRKHSLGDHPIFPASDESTFEQKIVGERFKDVMLNYKSKFDVDTIDNEHVKYHQMPMMEECMRLEASHVKELEALAEKMIRDEYNMSEDMVEITCELTRDINMEGTKMGELPTVVEVEFDNHDSIKQANDNVYKRRFLNAMTQGAAKKSSHMFHMVDRELGDLDPRLTTKYAKLMAAADYCYFVVPDMHKTVKNTAMADGGQSMSGGVVRVTLPTDANPKAHIHAQGVVFPVLVHELVKGVMEILSAHGLPEDDKIAEYVIGKGDFLAAESWDMRLGPALWERFTKMIDPDKFHLKHNIYSELAALPVSEFNYKMREIMSGTKDGKQIINDIIEGVSGRIQEDDYRDEIGDDDSDGFSLNDIDNINLDDLM